MPAVYFQMHSRILLEADTFNPDQTSLIWLHIVHQGLHTLEKYLNIQDCLEKSLKIKFTLKITWQIPKGLE